MAPTFPTNQNKLKAAETKGFPVNGTDLAKPYDITSPQPRKPRRSRKADLERHASKYRNGVSGPDLRTYLTLLPWFRKQGVVVHTTAAPHGAPEAEKFRLFDAVDKRLSTAQSRSDRKRRLSVKVRETRTAQGYSLHEHIIAVFGSWKAARKFCESIEKSKALKRLGEKAVVAKIVTDEDHWRRLDTYFTDEATMQAWVGFDRKFPKPKGPFPFDGDRVIPSPDAKDWLVKTGRMADWKRTNASRKPLVPMGARLTTKPHLVAVIPQPVEPAVAVVEQPVEIAADRQPQQLGLAFDAPAVNVFSLVEAKRRQMGISQRGVAAVLGLKQPGYANIIRGHDKPGEWVMRRAVEFVGGRLAA